MIRAMKLRRLAIVCWLAALSVPGLARADDPEVTFDARTQGYGKKTQLDEPGTATAWLIFTPLALIALGVMFKNANRTHLD